MCSDKVLSMRLNEEWSFGGVLITLLLPWAVRRVCANSQEARFSNAAIIAVAKSGLLFLR